MCICAENIFIKDTANDRSEKYWEQQRHESLTTQQKGIYQMKFHVGKYFESNGIKEYFYPSVTIDFKLEHPTEHYHVPLLLSPFGYSTYRGS